MAEFTVREAVPDDVPRILRLIKDLAVYVKEPESVVETTEEVLLQDGFGSNPWFHALVAEEILTTNSHIGKKNIVGFALYFHSYSTWQGRMLYLEDLFVEPTSRGKGIGKGLLKKVAEDAVTKGCSRIHWTVLDWNKPSQNFYESIGANCLNEWQFWRMDRKTMLEYIGKTQ